MCRELASATIAKRDVDVGTRTRGIVILHQTSRAGGRWGGSSSVSWVISTMTARGKPTVSPEDDGGVLVERVGLEGTEQHPNKVVDVLDARVIRLLHLGLLGVRHLKPRFRKKIKK